MNHVERDQEGERIFIHCHALFLAVLSLSLLILKTKTWIETFMNKMRIVTMKIKLTKEFGNRVFIGSCVSLEEIVATQ